MSITNEVISLIDHLPSSGSNNTLSILIDGFKLFLFGVAIIYILIHILSMYRKIPSQNKTKILSEEEKLILNKNNGLLTAYEESIYHDRFYAMTKIRANAQRREHLLQLLNLKFITSGELKWISSCITYEEKTKKFILKIDFFTLLLIVSTQLIVFMLLTILLILVGMIFIYIPLNKIFAPEYSSIPKLASMIAIYIFLFILVSFSNIRTLNILQRASKNLESMNKLDAKSNISTNNKNAFMILNRSYIRPFSKGKIKKIKTYFSM